MGFKVSMDEDNFKPLAAIRPGVYTVRLSGFKPKVSAKGNSINLNPQVQVQGGEFDGARIFTSLNNQMHKFIRDFVHSFGFPLEKNGIPGEFAGTFDSPGEYTGPLIGKTAEWEIGIGEYNGKVNNEVIRFICSLPDCGTLEPEFEHSKDMRRKG